MSPNTIAPEGQACSHAVFDRRRRRSGASRPLARISASPNALHAVRALLHHPARAHGDVGVVHHRHGWPSRLVIVEEVEAPDLVRAVVRAEPRADAAVVDHLVQPVVAVDRRVDRADVLAGRLLAVLAEHRLDEHPRVVGGSDEVAVDPQPVHLRGLATPALPTTGMLFSAWHATTQAPHPVQAPRSTAMPHCRAPFGLSS